MENEAAGAGYILAFFSDIENLTTYYSYYQNLLTRLEAKFPKDKKGLVQFNKMDDVERGQAEQLTESVRFYISRTWLKFSAIKEKVTEFKAKANEIDELYSQLKNQTTPSEEVTEKYVVLLNTMFVSGIASSVLVKAQEIYEQFMGKQ